MEEGKAILSFSCQQYYSIAFCELMCEREQLALLKGSICGGLHSSVPV